MKKSCKLLLIATVGILGTYPVQGAIIPVDATRTVIVDARPSPTWQNRNTATNNFPSAGKLSNGNITNGFSLFELPVIDPGETIDSVTFSVIYENVGGATPFSVSLYGMDLIADSNDNTTLTSMFGALGTTSPTQTGTLLDATFMGTDSGVTTNGQLITIDITDYVTSLTYTAGQYLVLRIAPEESVNLTEAGFSNTRYAYRGVGTAVPPALSITTVPVPEPSTYAALLGLTALGMVVLRRRRNR